MNDLEREMLYDERNKKRKLLLEKYELLKITRAQQQNKDLVIIFSLFIFYSCFWNQVCYKNVTGLRLRTMSVLTAKLAKKVTLIQEGHHHLALHLQVAPHHQATPLSQKSLYQRARRPRKSWSSWQRVKLESNFYSQQ
jgi:hypothetical protein